MRIQLRRFSNKSWSARNGGLCGFDGDFGLLTNPPKARILSHRTKPKFRGRSHGHITVCWSVTDVVSIGENRIETLRILEVR
jgi:hypothetical protein